MKRVLLLIPLLVLAGALLFFVLHRQGIRPGGPSKTSPAGAESSPSAGAGPSKAAPPAPPPATDLGDLAGSIRFTVTANNQPLQGAKITVQKSGTPDFMKFMTEADGTQFLYGLPPVEYAIRVAHPDYMNFDTTVFVESGKTVQITTNLRQGGRIYGTVTDKAGQPLPKTLCFLLGAGSRLTPATQLETDEKGQYAFKALPPGEYGVRFRHKKHKPQDRTGMLVRSHTDEYKVDVVLDLGAKVSGRILDPDGKPIAGAMVVGGTRGSAGLEYSAEDGSFSLGGLFELPVDLSVTKAEYGKVTLRDLPANGPDLEIRLPKAGRISARVVTEEPPRKIVVVLSAFDESLGNLVLADTKNFADPPGGAFVMPDVAPGSYWLDIQIEGYEALDRPQVTVASGQTVDGVVVRFKKKT